MAMKKRNRKPNSVLAELEVAWQQDPATTGPLDAAAAVASLIETIRAFANPDRFDPEGLVIAVVEWHMRTLRAVIAPLYFVEKADVCLRLADGNSSLRDELDAMAFEFIKMASTLEATLRDLRDAAMSVAKPEGES
jgi:hypothetical protein